MINRQKIVILSTVIVFATTISNTVLASCVAGKATVNLSLQNGVITDRKSSLVWQVCREGQEAEGDHCAGVPLDMSWDDAAEFAAKKEGGWRLPKLEDLHTVLESDGDSEGGKFPKPFLACESGQIWTASPGFPVNDVAAVLELANGRIWGTGKGVSRGFLLVKGEISLDYD